MRAPFSTDDIPSPASPIPLHPAPTMIRSPGVGSKMGYPGKGGCARRRRARQDDNAGWGCTARLGGAQGVGRSHYSVVHTPYECPAHRHCIGRCALHAETAGLISFAPYRDITAMQRRSSGSDQDRPVAHWRQERVRPRIQF